MNIKELFKNRLFYNLLLTVALFFAAFWAIFLSVKLQELINKRRARSFNPAEVVPPKEGAKDYENILSVVFLGQGGEGHSGGGLTDSIILLAVSEPNNFTASSLYLFNRRS